MKRPRPLPMVVTPSPDCPADWANLEAMTDLHPDKLVERLRKKRRVLIDNDELRHEMWLINPDGPAAANTIEALRARLDRVTEALKPSAETKAAYIGEFTIPWPVLGEDGDDHIIRINVPWTTIKEIMAAIRERAEALNGERM